MVQQNSSDVLDSLGKALAAQNRARQAAVETARKLAAERAGPATDGAAGGGEGQ